MKPEPVNCVCGKGAKLIQYTMPCRALVECDNQKCRTRLVVSAGSHAEAVAAWNAAIEKLTEERTARR